MQNLAPRTRAEPDGNHRVERHRRYGYSRRLGPVAYPRREPLWPPAPKDRHEVAAPGPPVGRVGRSLPPGARSERRRPLPRRPRPGRLAKKLDEVGQTASNAVLGTPSYMAP